MKQTDTPPLSPGGLRFGMWPGGRIVLRLKVLRPDCGCESMHSGIQYSRPVHFILQVFNLVTTIPLAKTTPALWLAEACSVRGNFNLKAGHGALGSRLSMT